MQNLLGGSQHGGRPSSESGLIEGVVNESFDARITLTAQGPTGQTRQFGATIDTGYSGSLTLPPAVVRELGLPFVGRVRAFLADATQVFLNVYEGTVLWDGQPRQITVHELDSNPLVDMALLREHNLSIDVERGGRVTIQAIV